METSNSKGFALVEVGLALPILTLAITGVFAAVYLCIAQAWLKDAGEEAALCVAEQVPVRTCKREFADKTESALPFGEFSKLSIEKYESRVVVRYIFKAVQVVLENEISLRLPVSQSSVGNL